MKVILVFTLACLVAVAFGRPQSKYTDKWDHINVEEILESQRLLKAYIDCLLDKGRCTPDAKALKETLPDALEHDCSKCTAKQKSGADTVIRHLINKRPEMWQELAVKYDPDHIYEVKYKEQIQKIKSN